MKILNRLVIICILLVMTLGFNYSSYANKSLSQNNTIVTQKKLHNIARARTKTNRGSVSRIRLNSKPTKKKKSPKIYSGRDFRYRGVIRWRGYRWTWYSQRVLPGRGLRIPGRHIDKQGYVCDKKNYICLASSSLKKGKILKTPFGKNGKIYDSGCAIGTVDVYVNW